MTLVDRPNLFIKISAAVKSGLTPPAAVVGTEQAALLTALQSLRDAEFDRAYVRQQLLVHAAALVAEQGYIREGTDANLLSVARSDLPMIERHLRSFQQLPPMQAG